MNYTSQWGNGHGGLINKIWLEVFPCQIEKLPLASRLPDERLESSRMCLVNEPGNYQWSIPLEQNLQAPRKKKHSYFIGDRQLQAECEAKTHWFNSSVWVWSSSCSPCTEKLKTFFCLTDMICCKWGIMFSLSLLLFMLPITPEPISSSPLLRWLHFTLSLLFPLAFIQRLM